MRPCLAPIYLGKVTKVTMLFSLTACGMVSGNLDLLMRCAKHNAANPPQRPIGWYNWFHPRQPCPSSSANKVWLLRVGAEQEEDRRQRRA